MAKHRSRFFTKALIGMGAVAVSAVTMSTPARAETIDLICIFENQHSFDQHVYIDTTRQSVVTTIEDKPYGPFAAAISDTLISWTIRGTDAEDRYVIDRVAGTIRWTAGSMWLRGLCRRATQKF